MKIKPAFTLVEVLIAVVVFVFVSILVTGTLASTARLTITHKQSQQIAVQSQRILEEIAKDIEGSQNVRTFHLTSTSNHTGSWQSYPDDDLVYIETGKRDQSGGVTGAVEYLIYCPVITVVSPNVLVGKRMARFRLPSAPVFNYTRNPKECTPASLALFTGIAAANIVPEFMTEASYVVQLLRFWPTWWVADCNGQLCDQNPQAVRMEISAFYSEDNGSTTTYNQRYNESALNVPPQSIRLTASRDPNFSFNP